MPQIKSTPEQIEKFTAFAEAKETYFKARALWECLKDSKKAFQATPQMVEISKSLELAANTQPRNEATINAIIEMDVELDSQWEVDHQYWPAFDLLSQAEELLFDTALACMEVTGHDQRMIAGGVNKAMFIKAKKYHPLSYPKLIEICAKFNPNL